MLDFQTIITNAIQSKRNEEMKTSPQLTLSELILKLEAISEDFPIYFDDLKHRPTSIGSWRGSYDELSINYKGDDSINSDEIDKTYQFSDGEHKSYKSINTYLPKNVRVKDLLKILKLAIGKTMTGYKGGDFLIGKTTPLWVSAYGENSGYKTNKNYDTQAIIGVIIKGRKAILQTELIHY